MGAWGKGAFEADQAVDWVWSFKQVGAQAGLDLIESALASVAVKSIDDYLEEDPAVVAIAAATLLTAAMGLPVEGLRTTRSPSTG